MKRLTVLVLVVTAAIALALAAWFRPHWQARRLAHASAHALAWLPEDYRAATLAVSEDGQDYAFVAQGPYGWRVVQDGREGPVYAECSPPQFAPESKRVFYWARHAESRYQRILNVILWWRSSPESPPILVANGQEIVTGLSRHAPIIFNSQGTRWAVVGKFPDRTVDGKADVGSMAVFADGQLLGRYKEASLPAFSRDGTHLAYLVRGDEGLVKLIVDGNERRTFEPATGTPPEITQGDDNGGLTPQLNVMYLFDDTLLAIVPGGDGWMVVQDDRQLASYSHNVSAPEQGVAVKLGGIAGTSSAVFSKSLSSASKAPVGAWWERLTGSEERWRVVHNGTPDAALCARYWKNELPAWSPDGQHLAYPCYLHSEEQDDDVMVVIDGKQFGPYQNAWGLSFSDDSAHVAYVASDGTLPYDWSYHVDGKISPLKFEQVWQPRFNQTGTHIAWEAQRGKRPVLFLDGREIRSFDDVLWGPVFSPADTVSWVIRRGRRVVRVEVPVSGPQMTSDK